MECETPDELQCSQAPGLGKLKRTGYGAHAQGEKPVRVMTYIWKFLKNACIEVNLVRSSARPRSVNNNNRRVLKDIWEKRLISYERFTVTNAKSG